MRLVRLVSGTRSQQSGVCQSCDFHLLTNVGEFVVLSLPVCPYVDTTCSKPNICKTCDTFGGMGGKCSEIDYFPNATVAEYGLIELDENVVNKIKTELFVRGPVAATINGTFG